MASPPAEEELPSAARLFLSVSDVKGGKFRLGSEDSGTLERSPDAEVL